MSNQHYEPSLVIVAKALYLSVQYFHHTNSLQGYWKNQQNHNINVRNFSSHYANDIWHLLYLCMCVCAIPLQALYVFLHTLLSLC